MKRRGVAIAVLLATMLIVTACMPRDMGTIGVLRNDDGSYTALVRMCRGSLVTLTLDSYPTGADGAPSSDDSESSRKIEIPIGNAPEGSVDVPLKAIEASGRGNDAYMLRGIGTEGNAWSVSFGVSDLDGLQPGDVLAEINRDDAEKKYTYRADGSGVYVAVAQEEFEARATKFCE